VSALSLLVLFGASFAAATILPLSSEVPLVVLVRQSGVWFVPVLVATAGNVLGACTTYALGRLAIRSAPPSPRTDRAAAVLRTYGAPALLLSWVPLVGDLLVIIAGAARMHAGWFTFWTTAGKFARYVAVAFAARQI
jgi:membrane protein YqaA with SNARE-associated domain